MFLKTIAENQIGPSLRRLRVERGLTIAVLAERSGFSKGYLSKVENSKTAPPVSTLMVLAQALGINISELFSAEQTATNVTVVKKGERQTISRGATGFGYSYQPLAPTFPHKHVEPHILVVPPTVEGTKSFQHKGQQMVFVLEGTLIMKVDGTEYVLEEGDCIYFNSGLPHSARVQGDREVTCLSVFCNEK